MALRKAPGRSPGERRQDSEAASTNWGVRHFLTQAPRPAAERPTWLRVFAGGEDRSGTPAAGSLSHPPPSSPRRLPRPPPAPKQPLCPRKTAAPDPGAARALRSRPARLLARTIVLAPPAATRQMRRESRSACAAGKTLRVPRSGPRPPARPPAPPAGPRLDRRAGGRPAARPGRLRRPGGGGSPEHRAARTAGRRLTCVPFPAPGGPSSTARTPLRTPRPKPPSSQPSLLGAIATACLAQRPAEGVIRAPHGTYWPTSPLAFRLACSPANRPARPGH